MSFHVPETARVTQHPQLGTTWRDGNNGAFDLDSCEPGWRLTLICSDGTEDPTLPVWEHVSVHAYRGHDGPTLRLRTPNWREMAFIKGSLLGRRRRGDAAAPEEIGIRQPASAHAPSLAARPRDDPDATLDLRGGALMGALDDLGYLNAQHERRAVSKRQMLPAPLVKADKKKAKKVREDDFRKAVWLRDKARSRASGKPLARSGTDYSKVGEVHHVIPRSLAPERLYDTTNGILLSKHEHCLAETACPNEPAHCLLDISGPDDRGEPQLFIWRDVHGTETKRRVG